MSDTSSTVGRREETEFGNDSRDVRMVNPSMLRHDAYSVGWVCALPKEQTAAISMLDERHPDMPNMKPPNDTNAYTLGSIGKHNIVIACLPKGQIGTVSAATVASKMVTTFPSIKVGLMVGIGGGIPSKVRLGDVVVSTPSGTHPGVVQWDMGKTRDGGRFERTGALNNPPTFLLTALTRLECDHDMIGSKIPEYLDDLERNWPRLAPKYLRSDSLRDVVFKADCSHMDRDETQESVGSEDDDEPENCRYCDKTKAKERKPKETGVHYGLVASGNQVIKDGIFRDKLNKDLGGNVLCIEMEAAGLMANFPCLVIRGICDYADSHKNKDWQEHAAAVAAAFAKELLGYVEPEVIREERSVKEKLEDIHDIVTTTESKVERLGRHMTKKQDVEVLEWLTPYDYGPQQSDFLARHQPGTGQWFLGSNVFQTWMQSKGTTLFCPGIPGSGKTIITSVVIDRLSQEFHEDKTVGIAYIFCNYLRHGQQSLQDLLASLLKQLSQSLEDLPQGVKALYDCHAGARTRPSSAELAEALLTISTLYSKLFIIVDALDECQSAGDCRSSFLVYLSRVQVLVGANIMCTSRHIPEIEEQFRGCFKLEIKASDDDVYKYVDNHLSKALQSIPETPDLQDAIKSKIMRLADGMFLLAKLYLDSLRDKTSATEVRQALADIEHQSNKHATDNDKRNVLYQTYDQAMDRINNHLPGFRNLGMKTLAWIVHAERPLTTSELQHALAVNEGDVKLDRENIRKVEVVLSVCAGLVTVDENSDVVRLAHFTTQEYFRSTQTQYFPNAQSYISTACVTYLSFHGYTYPRRFDGKLPPELEPLSLFSYAAENWGHHARKCAAAVQSVVDFLTDDISVGVASSLLCNYAQLSPDRHWRGLHAAAFFNLREISDALIQRGFDVNSATRELKLTPLMIAAGRGFEELAILLLNNGADVRLTNCHGYTSLLFAADAGNLAITKLLLDKGADVHQKDDCGRTPLHLACYYGRLDMVRLLLQQGAKVGIKSMAGSTPLSEARKGGHEAVVKFLLEWGATHNSSGADEWEAIVKSLGNRQRMNQRRSKKMLKKSS
ncbi:ankyrin repeat protein [Colletotrichum truncatum]|uniref:Ankyrin repeat protein n=1 Tax=Colletotrichum truncatum TaxID=5467 RepID=A0ACC3ZHD5_COLTU|nr:ankyrin repeat protein [Colletotrichum truncatum]KAF6790652.1 ankyrin repeat protein [Colletotrichum truncatum]